MTVRQECPKARRKLGSPCVFCEDGSYCAHQYLCHATRRYENSEFRLCKRLNQKTNLEGKENMNGPQKVIKRRPRKG